MNFHFRPPRFKDPPPSSPHSGFHPPPFSPVEEEEEEESSLPDTCCCPSIRPRDPSFSSNPSLPSAFPSFSLSLSNFFPFFHFLRFLSVDKAFSFRFVSFSFFSFFFYYSCLWFLVSPSEREEKRKRDLEVFPSSREGDVFHRRCVAGVSLLFLVLLDGFFNFISFN